MSFFRYRLKEGHPHEVLNARGVNLFKTWFYTADQAFHIHAFDEFREHLDAEFAELKEDLEAGKGKNLWTHLFGHKADEPGPSTPVSPVSPDLVTPPAEPDATPAAVPAESTLDQAPATEPAPAPAEPTQGKVVMAEPGDVPEDEKPLPSINVE